MDPEDKERSEADLAKEVEARQKGAHYDYRNEAGTIGAEVGASTGAGVAGGDGTVVPAPAPALPVNGDLFGLLAEFHTPGQLVAAAEKVKNAGFTEHEWDCYSPIPVHGIDEAMGIKRTILPLIVFSVGFSGLLGGFFLQWWMNSWNWPWIVAGKPAWSIPAQVPIAFEMTILLSVFAAFFGMWALNKLPQWYLPWFRNDRFLRATDDRFFIGIRADAKRFDIDSTAQLLRGAGAAAIEPCYLDPDPVKKRVPKPLIAFVVVSAMLSTIPIALIYKARASKSNLPHYHIFSDMDFQRKAKSDQAFDLFADNRENRGQIDGTVAQGQLRDDDFFYRGIEGDHWATQFPVQITTDADAMKRGQQRFDIYCAPCHGVDGGGKGAIATRANRVPQNGWAPPANLTQENFVRQPNGQLFSTISNGKGVMKAYAAQIPTEDRWKIVLYVRALQRAANSTDADRPKGQ